MIYTHTYYILYPHYPLKNISPFQGLKRLGSPTKHHIHSSERVPILPPGPMASKQAPDVFLPERTQVFWVFLHPFCLVFSNTYIYICQYIYIYIYSVTGCQASSRLRKEIKVERMPLDACKGRWIIFGIPVFFWDFIVFKNGTRKSCGKFQSTVSLPLEMISLSGGNGSLFWDESSFLTPVWWETLQQMTWMRWLPGTTCHWSKWPKWMVSSLSKQPFLSPFADSSYPAIPKKPWDFWWFVYPFSPYVGW